MYECPSCDRDFDTGHSLHQHSVGKHPTTYCSPCGRHFSSRSAKQQHIANSSQHCDNICTRCAHIPDFDTESELNDHLAEEHAYCTACDRGFESQAHLVQHDVSEHHMCMDCPGRYFQSVSNLKNVSFFLFAFVLTRRLILFSIARRTLLKLSNATDVAESLPPTLPWSCISRPEPASQILTTISWLRLPLIATTLGTTLTTTLTSLTLSAQRATLRFCT